MDGAGIIEAFGPDCTRDDLRAGQRVWVCRSVSGTYAQFAVCDEKRVMPLGKDLTFSQGAGVGVAFLTAWVALHEKARITPGMRVLVHGASGGVGMAAVQIARAAGCHVAGTAGTPEGAALVRSCGAHECFMHRDPDYTSRLRVWTKDAGFDAIIEVLANENLQRDLELVAFAGVIVVVGNRGQATIDARRTMQRDARIVGMSLMNADDQVWKRATHGVQAGLANGTLRVHVRTGEGEALTLEHASRAHELVMRGGASGKIVLEVPPV
jgi:NADPH2:quinone reductase